MPIESFAKGTQLRSHFLSGSHSRIIGSDEGAWIPLSRGQNAQMKSKRSLCVITGDPRHTCAYAAKSSGAQDPHLRPIGRFMNAYAILWQKLYVRPLEQTFDQGNRVLVSRVATDINIRDRVSMQTGRLSQIPNRLI